MNKRQAAGLLRDAVVCSNQLHASYLRDADATRGYERFIELQLHYFLPRYDDLRASQAYSDAIDFVVNDLTGTRIAARDRELEKVVPLMSRVLPTRALTALTTAMTLNERVLQININIAASLADKLAAGEPISEHDYCMASREHATMSDFDALIAMTRTAGEHLARIVRLPMIGSLLKSMRLPAKLAGVLDLHEFLQRGLDTFLQLDDVPEFLDTMQARMHAIFSHVFEAPSQTLDTAPIVP
ncbi:MAG: hypothetical protein AAFO81_01010 [Pseudomonadota bacterium]